MYMCSVFPLIFKTDPEAKTEQQRIPIKCPIGSWHHFSLATTSSNILTCLLMAFSSPLSFSYSLLAQDSIQHFSVFTLIPGYTPVALDSLGFV